MVSRGIRFFMERRWLGEGLLGNQWGGGYKIEGVECQQEGVIGMIKI